MNQFEQRMAGPMELSDRYAKEVRTVSEDVLAGAFIGWSPAPSHRRSGPHLSGGLAKERGVWEATSEASRSGAEKARRGAALGTLGKAVVTAAINGVDEHRGSS